MEPRKKQIITTGGAGYFPDQPSFIKNLNPPKSKEEARLRLYNKVAPYWGFTDDTIKAFIDTMLYGDNAFSRSVGKPDMFGKPNPPIAIEDPYADGVYAEYLQIPENKRRSKYKLQKSKYRPTVGDEDVSYYTIPIDAETKDAIVENATLLPIGKNTLSTILMGYNHGEHTIGNGMDKKRGQYVSYYDRWDLNPLSSRYSSETKLKNNPLIKKLGLIDNRKRGDLSLGLGRPIDFYDRIYLDDYYGVDSSARSGTYYGGYLPEIFVSSFGDGVTAKRMGNVSHNDVLLKPRQK